MVEAAPAAALVVPEPDFLLEILVIPLDAPAQLSQVDQIGEAGLLGQGRQPVLRRLRLALGPLDQQPFLLARRAQPGVGVRGAHPGPGKARGKLPVRSFAPAASRGCGTPGRSRRRRRRATARGWRRSRPPPDRASMFRPLRRSVYRPAVRFDVLRPADRIRRDVHLRDVLGVDGLRIAVHRRGARRHRRRTGPRTASAQSARSAGTSSPRPGSRRGRHGSGRAASGLLGWPGPRS